MNSRLPLLVLAAFSASSAFAAAPAADTGIGRRYAEVRSRIDALFAYRDNPPPPITPADNPFLTLPPPAARPSEGTPAAAPARAPVKASKLQQIVATFRFTGTVQVGGTSQLVINSAPRKDGDLISVMWEGSPIFVRINLTVPGIVTFSLDGESINLRY